MKKSMFITIILAFFLSACNIPSGVQPTVDIIATQVARMLTEMYTETPIAPPATDLPPTPELSVTPEFTATNTEVPTNTPTVTPDQSDPAVSLGAPTWTEEFSSSSGKWEFSNTWSSFHVAGDYLNIIAKDTANWHSWYVTSPKIKNFYLEMTFDMPLCSGHDRVGLAFRARDINEFYYMGITCDGSWGFYHWTPSGDVLQILPFTQTNEFKPSNEINRVGVKAVGSYYEFYVNGKKVGQANDSNLLDTGFIGFITAYSEVNGFTTRVDKLQYWELP